MCVMCLFKYMYWWTYSRLAALETLLLPPFFFFILFFTSLFCSLLLFYIIIFVVNPGFIRFHDSADSCLFDTTKP